MAILLNKNHWEGEKVKKSLFSIAKQLQKNKINSFYLNCLYNGQTLPTRIFNFFLNRMLVFIISFLLFILFTEGERFYASFAAAFSVLLIYHFIMKYLEEIKLNQVIYKVNEKIGRENFFKKIKSMDHESFINFIKEILEELPGFADIQVTEYLEDEGINLLCQYRGELTAIQGHLLDGENMVEARRARQLSRAMSKRGYKKAIIISTTDFREDTKLFCDLIREKRQISLLGQEEFIQMAKDAGKFPNEAEIRNLILKKLEHKERVWHKNSKKIFAKPRITGYLVYGIFLLFIGFFEGDFQHLYWLCALILFVFGLTGIFLNMTPKKSLAASWQDLLDAD